MSFEVIDSLFTIKADGIMTVAMAAVILLIGFFIKSKVKFLEKYCIPAPVVGGFLFMFVTFIGHVTGTFAFSFDSMYQSPFMLAFFTTVGLGASISLLKKGGMLLIVYWLIAGIISAFQNVIGIGVGKLVGLEAPYALLSSAISMVGGPVGRRLIVKYNLKPDASENFESDINTVNAARATKLSSLDVIKNVTALLVCMALGTMVSGWIGKCIGMSFPTYVGAMFVAVIVRNLNEKFNFYNFDFAIVDGIGDVMLSLYLSIALMTLKLWELAGLIGGVLVVLICQVVFMVLVSYFVVFRLLGKNYDAAVMCAGLCGHGLGATPSAIVNMTAVNERYGMSRRAMMIVPIVGAFLVDIIYQPQTIWFIKTFVQGFVG